jgi:hypothetical protein
MEYRVLECDLVDGDGVLPSEILQHTRYSSRCSNSGTRYSSNPKL